MISFCILKATLAIRNFVQEKGATNNALIAFVIANSVLSFNLVGQFLGRSITSARLQHKNKHLNQLSTTKTERNKTSTV